MGLVIGNIEYSLLPDAVKADFKPKSSSIIPGYSSPILPYYGGGTGNEYGVEFNGIHSTGFSMYDADDLNWTPATPSSPGVDDFKDIYPFNAKKCITDYDPNTGERVVLAYEDPVMNAALVNPGDYATLKANKVGDRMVEFPLGWYKRPDPWTFIVSDTPLEGFLPSPAHVWGNEIFPVVRRSEFNISNVSGIPRSIPGSTPWADITRESSRNKLRNRGMVHQTYGMWCWINILRMIKQKNLNSQKVNGNGTYPYSSVIKEDNIQGLDGYIGLTSAEPVRTLGIQSFYGQIEVFIDNIVCAGSTYSEVWINEDPRTFTTYPYNPSTEEGWKKFDVPLGGNGYYRSIAYNINDPYALYASQIGGDDNNPVGDEVWVGSNNFLVGGHSGIGTRGGSLTYTSNINFSVTRINSGVAAVELPSGKAIGTL